MNKSESIKELATALAKAQAEIENASKSSVNPHFKSKYADLAEVLNTVRPVFSKHGISVIQAPSYEAGIAGVETMLMHSSGEWLSNTCSAPVSKQDAQGVGSAVTYLRRYSLASFAGIAQEDDDANAAVGQRQTPAPARPAEKPALPDDRFRAACDAIAAGKTSVQVVRSRYTLTTEQDNELHVLESAQ
jgi:hypothetical protein